MKKSRCGLVFLVFLLALVACKNPAAGGKGKGGGNGQGRGKNDKKNPAKNDVDEALRKMREDIDRILKRSAAQTPPAAPAQNQPLPAPGPAAGGTRTSPAKPIQASGWKDVLSEEESGYHIRDPM